MNQTSQKQKLLDDLYKKHVTSEILHIKDGSKKIIFGEGNPNSNIIFIGEAPGAQEDLEGRPFVGRSGRLLNKLLELANVKREDVFITNTVKCRPPNNRKPFPKEMANSRELLLEQIGIINPTVICTLGASALEGLMSKPAQITKNRGRFISYNHLLILPTYHPAFILRNPKELETLAHDIILVCQKAEQLAKERKHVSASPKKI
jgi:uracil-DNA glycosylase family 4